VNAKYDILGGKIAQGQGGIETDDEARDEVLEERSGPVVLRAVGGKPFVVVLAKALQEGESGWITELSSAFTFIASPGVLVNEIANLNSYLISVELAASIK
jgi:hypothetical protein